MTPAARLSAAISVLDGILAGLTPERALADWTRASRFAGSGDRAALRDLVYQALRCRRSFGFAGGSDSGRGLILGGLRLAGTDPAELFTGQGHAPPPVTEAEPARSLAMAPRGVRLDLPDWLLPYLDAALGDEVEPVAEQLRHRAPIWLRVNLGRTGIAEAAAALAAEAIATRPHPDINSALQVTENERKIKNSVAYAQGLVELQDASSQAVVLALGELAGQEVLDYCAGAGGKALQLADRGARVTAHDADPRRMRDLGPRATRAGAAIDTATTAALSGRHWPLVLLDAPCSGSGTWRRDPMGKWLLTEARLAELTTIQDAILDAAAPLVAPGGRLAWVTCSMLPDENRMRVDAFLSRNPDWRQLWARRFLPGSLGDGFSVTILGR